MNWRFTKMHGTGNDYVYVECFTQKKPSRLPALAQAVSHRHFGIGSDGLILILPPRNSDENDCRMEMYNSDGSRGAMCGNGVRCVAKYVYDRRLVRKERLRVETDSGVKVIELETRNGKAVRATVDMGEPIFERKKIPMTGARPIGLGEKIRVAGRTFETDCLSMGNPHGVIFVKDERAVPIEAWGPAIQKLSLFPKSVNVEFVRVIRPGEIAQRTYERGAGETWACGTGACAAAVATILRGKARGRVRVHLLGGALDIAWKPGQSVFMTGPAVEVFSGEFAL